MRERTPGRSTRAWRIAGAPHAAPQAGHAFGASQRRARTFFGSLVVGDFNRDGRLDVVAGNQGSDNVSLLLGD